MKIVVDDKEFHIFKSSFNDNALVIGCDELYISTYDFLVKDIIDNDERDLIIRAINYYKKLVIIE